MLALGKMQLLTRTALAVDVLTLLVAAVLAALAAGHGQISAADAQLAAIDVSFVLLAMHVRGRRVSQLQASAIDGCIEALKVCSLGALLALATAAILGADRPVPIGPELWLLTAVAMCGARLTMHLGQRRARRRGALMTPTLIVGERPGRRTRRCAQAAGQARARASPGRRPRRRLHAGSCRRHHGRPVARRP